MMLIVTVEVIRSDSPANTVIAQIINPSDKIEMKSYPINNIFKLLAKNLQFNFKKYDKW